jgi:hypothetical protein
MTGMGWNRFGVVTPILVSAHFRTFLPGSFKMVCHLLRKNSAFQKKLLT